ncbi:hypothetical protein SAMN04487948_10389 [Halogranum amylolyticum]|uniref:Uncharacterized protein n=1 Tax=Halogranum amylolyticum TaxID=660520 RepID=A0A1H8QG46_9EURY|nr:hypothetical protein [Halogranum amylolyticum]SEO52874.1 hypothetical protein SAMN04487948_10389 [Halogranum amylolyticum]
MATDASSSTTDDVGFDTTSLTRLHYLGVALAAVTGVIHLVLGVGFLPSPLAVSFVLAGLGFFGGVALFLFGVRRRQVVAVGIPFTLLQFFAYFALNWPDVVSPVGLFDKVVQLALVGVLVAVYRAESAEN